MSSSGRVKAPVSPGDVVAGKYRVERVLGSGGMGIVVAARHLDLDQPVALKFILPHALAGKGNIERFMREARAAVRLKSEHVARVYDVGRDGEDRPFMVLELLEGMDLSKLSKQKGALPVADAVEYVLQACEALVEAHAAGIVHRDLKPQNLFVTRRLNGTALIKVLDFGIAKAIGPGAIGQMALTDSAAIIGSPLYMAPEQMRSARTAEIRSDIWALGVILYELLGGKLPFDGETVTEVCIRVVNESPAALLELRPALDPALVKIVMRCLEKEPDARFHNVSALAAALEPFSRSAQQGGLVRPWRSFEDTQDSAQGGGNPFAAALAQVDAEADATGPSTAVTIQTLPPLDGAVAVSAENGEPSEDERRARAAAGSTKASAGSSLAQSDRPLVSTDVTWGESSAPKSVKTRPRSFSTGMVLGLVVSAAAAAVVLGLWLGRGSRANANATATTTGAAPPSAAVIVPPSAAPVPSAAPAASAVAVAVPGATNVTPVPSPRSVTTPPTAASVQAARLTSAGKVPRASGRGAPVAAAEPNTSTPSTPAAAATTRAPDPKAADPVSPNGAPILH